MTFINRLADERRRQYDNLEAIRDVINLDLFQDIYPGKAHLIFELLQNAEDAGASRTRFLLSENSLCFEHDGQPFSEDDVDAITSFGISKKGDTVDAIGQFGIGFKSVFSYTETPRIWSPTFSFEIFQEIIPSELPTNPELGDRTQFEFPFNKKKMPPCQAYAELQTKLEEISDIALLFLSNIKEIRWQIGDVRKGRLLRVQHTEHHVEILRENEEAVTDRVHFLSFSEPVRGLDGQCVSIAFELQPQASYSTADTHSSIASRFRITSADRGCVAVYFTAEKETSNLRFHLHAPFVPVLNRSSLKDTLANVPLFQQLAVLAACSLSKIRDLDLLDREFLAVLPNSHDGIPDQYVPIWRAIVKAMNEQPLTPVHIQSGGGHAPASKLLQAEDRLKSLLNHDDIRFLIDDDNVIGWAVAETLRGSNVYWFLSDLNIKRWGVEQFAQALIDRCSTLAGDSAGSDWGPPGATSSIITWMRGKSIEWHCVLYSLLQDILGRGVAQLKPIPIVRLSDNLRYKMGFECYFSTSETDGDDSIHPRVAIGTYKGGSSKSVQASARAFLEGIGVREVGVSQEIEAVLKQRYTKPGLVDWSTYENDLRRFINLLNGREISSSLFMESFIFQRSDSQWSKPFGVYLDEPYVDTGLHSYYENVSSGVGRVALSPKYMEFDWRGDFVEFAQRCGVVDRLAISETTCRKNPRKQYLECAPGIKKQTGRDQDFVIAGLEPLLAVPSFPLSRLVWNTLCQQANNQKILKACLQKNQSNTPRYADSQLICQLRRASWIPQNESDGSLSFVRPALACRNSLPGGFPYDPDWSWLDAIGFGTENESSSSQQAHLQELGRELGFSDAAVMLAQRFDMLSPDVQKRVLANLERERVVELPKREPGNRDERSRLVRQRAKHAPSRNTEMRRRSVSVNRDAVKREDADPYLQDLYTNSDGVTICQACQDRLPFRLADGSYFFESVEFLKDLKRHHFQNYLALCPNHAAMYKYANPLEDEMKDRFLAMAGSEMDLTLADQRVTIYFTETHVVDLKAVIDSDGVE